MKLSGGDSELLGMPVDTLLNMNSWNNNDYSSADVRHFLMDEEDTKLLGDDDESIDQKPTLDDLDLYLNTSPTPPSSQLVNQTLAELKPLPPFTGYTGHLSINGISGHCYHTIATGPNSTRLLIETNNNSVDTTNQNNVPYYSTDHVVSSSTMDNTIDSINKSESGALGEYVLPNDMEDDFATLIGSAMADTTVPGNRVNGDDSRDSWYDLDLWINKNCPTSSLPTSSKPNVGNSHSSSNNNNNSSSNNNNNNCSSNNNNNINNNNNHNHNNNNNNVLCADSMPDFVTNSHFTVAPQPSQVIGFNQQRRHQPPHHHNQQREINTSYSHMPLLHNRLTQNGAPKPSDSQEIAYNIVSECPSPSSSTQYLAHSPPCHVVSTSDIGYIQVHSSTRPSPELQGSYPHTTTTTTTTTKKSRTRTKSKISPSNIVYNDANLSKEKTIHRCNICQRGFLNKSNIKVHLRTHTGEKPFRCEVCAKAFRQKAHLIKHAQIHKRVGRD